MRSVFGTEGSIREVNLLPAFVALWRAQESGRLDFSRGGVAVAFDLRDGDVVGVSATEPQYDTAAVLIRAGKLDSGALERLAIRGGLPPALAALQAGLLTKREWRWGEKIRAIEVLTDLLSWPEGRYRFDRDFSPEPSEFHLPVPRLLLELFLRSRDEDLVRDALGDESAPLHRSPNFEEEFSSFGLTADAESVIRLIDGKSSPNDIASKAPADAFAVRKLLAALSVLGLARSSPQTGPRGLVAVPDPSPEEPESEAPEDSASTVALRSEEFAPSPIDLPPAASLDSEIPRSYEEAERFRDLSPAVADYDSLEAQAPSRGPELEEAWDIAPPERGAADLAIDDGPGPVLADPEPRRRGPGLALFGVLLLLAAIVGAVLWLRSRPVSTTTAGLPAPTPTEAPAALPEPTAAAVAEPTAAPVTEPTLAAPPTRAALPPTARPRPEPTARASAPPPPLPVAGASRSSWDERASRDRRRLVSEPATRYTIQLMLACEVSSLTDAWKHDRPEGTMWLVASTHRGRSCYRVLWGRYPTLEAARAGQDRVPEHFRTRTNRPAVIDARKTLLP
jgi:hypothetical protein